MRRSNCGPSDVGTKQPSGWALARHAGRGAQSGERKGRSSASSVQHSPLRAAWAEPVQTGPCSTLLSLWKPANLNSECNISWCVWPDRRVLGVYLFSNVKPWSATLFCLCWCIISCKYSVLFFLFISTDHTVISHKLVVMCNIYTYIIYFMCKYIVYHYSGILVYGSVV